jgi:hypothetical protein
MTESIVARSQLPAAHVHPANVNGLRLVQVRSAGVKFAMDSLLEEARFEPSVIPDLGQMTLLIDDFVTPNGLAFSPDEIVLYINDSGGGGGIPLREDAVG